MKKILTLVLLGCVLLAQPKSTRAYVAGYGFDFSLQPGNSNYDYSNPATKQRQLNSGLAYVTGFSKPGYYVSSYISGGNVSKVIDLFNVRPNGVTYDYWNNLKLDATYYYRMKAIAQTANPIYESKVKVTGTWTP